MNLYFVRHGSAGDPKPSPREDAARELDREVRRQCELIGKLLVAFGIRFNEVVSSPLKRASEICRHHCQANPLQGPDRSGARTASARHLRATGTAKSRWCLTQRLLRAYLAEQDAVPRRARGHAK